MCNDAENDVKLALGKKIASVSGSFLDMLALSKVVIDPLQQTLDYFSDFLSAS